MVYFLDLIAIGLQLAVKLAKSEGGQLYLQQGLDPPKEISNIFSAIDTHVPKVTQVNKPGKTVNLVSGLTSP